MKNAEFNNKKLAQIYENFNQFSEDEDFWLRIIKSLWVKNIIDFWAGTWIFTLVLLDRWYELIAIEPSHEMLAIAKSKTHSDRIKWLQWSTNKLEGFKTDLILMTSHVAQFITGDNEWRELLEKSHAALNSWWYILFDSKNPLLKPWENYTRENYNRTKDTVFWEVNMQIDLKDISGNVITHSIHYNFLETWEKFVSDNTLIYRSKGEIEESLKKAGFEIIKTYGDWSSQEYSEESSEMIFLAQKV